jgi:non-homologous end joining protein Ku
MNIKTFLQQQEIISVREFVHNFSKITSKPKRKMYTIVKNGKKVGTYTPIEYEDEYFTGLEEMIEEEPKKYNSLFDNYDKIAFKTGDPLLSQKIDDILYGKA